MLVPEGMHAAELKRFKFPILLIYITLICVEQNVSWPANSDPILKSWQAAKEETEDVAFTTAGFR